MFDKIYAQNDVVGLALNAYAVRNEVIQHNIANNDTPGYKKRIVEFEEAFSAALENSKRTGTINPKKIEPKVRMIHENYSFRLDGNNVDTELEMVDLYKNSVKYDVLASAVINNYRKINLVATGR